MADRITYITTRTGSVAKIIGSAAAVNRVIRALRQAGARWNPTVETFDFGFYDDTPKAKPKLVTVIHPLPIGTRIKSIAGEVDDPGDGTERKSGRGAIGKTILADHYKGQGWSYGVVFPSGTWVNLDEGDGLDDPRKYRILPPKEST